MTDRDFPIVYTENNRYEPESVHKHAWGVVMITEDRKITYPWDRVQAVHEAKPDQSLEWKEMAGDERIY